MNPVWNDAKELAESKGWIFHTMINGHFNDCQIQAVTICEKAAPWKEENGEPGREFFTHRFYWRHEDCQFMSGNYMMRSFDEAYDDAVRRG
jgi:hypothetical protein